LRRDRSPAPGLLLPASCTAAGLPATIEAALRTCSVSGPLTALMCIALEHIKAVNEDFGHDAGDAVIEGLTMRVRTRLRPDSALIRIGGASFLAIIQNVQSEAEALSIGSRILHALEQPCSFGADEVSLTGTIGITLYPLHGTDPAALLQNARQALETATLHGGAQARLYNAGREGLSIASREASLRNALQRSEFELLFQPQIDIRTGEVGGTEVLLSWQHPELGRIPADAFIPAAETTRLIRPIGIWVLKEACRCAEPWIAARPGFTLAVNVSAVQFATPEFLDGVADLLSSTSFPAESLELEITETVLLREGALAVAIEALERLRRLGVRIALDDFGAGYSSLAYLRDLPLDTLKIDRSFLLGAEPGNRSALLLGAIAAMGHSLGLKVVAEGVENEDRYAIAREAGCDLAQGYLFGAPMDSNHMTALIMS
jgi:diguanylate cyclase (GGDEF)-like protein